MKLKPLKFFYSVSARLNHNVTEPGVHQWIVEETHEKWIGISQKHIEKKNILLKKFVEE